MSPSAIWRPRRELNPLLSARQADVHPGTLRRLALRHATTRTRYQAWYGWEDSNLRPPGPRPGVLPLRYTHTNYLANDTTSRTNENARTVMWRNARVWSLLLPSAVSRLPCNLGMRADGLLREFGQEASMRTRALPGVVATRLLRHVEARRRRLVAADRLQRGHMQ